MTTLMLLLKNLDYYKNADYRSAFLRCVGFTPMSKGVELSPEVGVNSTKGGIT